LTTSPCGESLYVLLQSAPVQDGGPSKATNIYTRFLKYNVKNLNNIKVDAEYIVPLPQSSKGNTLAQSELLWLNDNQCLVLARDGNGAGDTDTESKYKCISPPCVLFHRRSVLTRSPNPSQGSGPDRHVRRYQHRGNQVRLTFQPRCAQRSLGQQYHPTAYQPFVQYINSTQLARFGLHNGSVLDQELIAGKWEALALAPAYDRNAKDD